MKRQEKHRLRGWPLLGLAAMGALVAAAVALRAWMPTVCRHPGTSERTDASALKSAALLYLADRNWGSCPKAEDLKHERYLDSTRNTVDAWGTAFRIECSNDEVVVISAGPDKAFDTEDDIGRSN